jgi:hypothetical protein
MDRYNVRFMFGVIVAILLLAGVFAAAFLWDPHPVRSSVDGCSAVIQGNAATMCE